MHLMPIHPVLAVVKTVERVEIADGPVQGYRATRSASVTKTDPLLKEVPASIKVIPPLT